jgi:superkiller protein 3
MLGLYHSELYVCLTARSLLFLGHAQDKLKQRKEAEDAYQRAATIKPEEDKAWLALRQLYERDGAVTELVQVTFKLAQIYLKQ